jgi:hypothetical protein
MRKHPVCTIEQLLARPIVSQNAPIELSKHAAHFFDSFEKRVSGNELAVEALYRGADRGTAVTGIMRQHASSSSSQSACTRARRSGVDVNRSRCDGEPWAERDRRAHHDRPRGRSASIAA